MHAEIPRNIIMHGEMTSARGSNNVMHIMVTQEIMRARDNMYISFRELYHVRNNDDDNNNLPFFFAP